MKLYNLRNECFVSYFCVLCAVLTTIFQAMFPLWRSILKIYAFLFHFEFETGLGLMGSWRKVEYTGKYSKILAVTEPSLV